MKVSHKVFDRITANTRDLFSAIVDAKALMKQDNPKVRGSMAPDVRVIVRKDVNTGEMTLEIGD